MKTQYDFLYGLDKAPVAARKRDEMWKSVAKELNDIPMGGVKLHTEWRATFTNMRIAVSYQ